MEQGGGWRSKGVGADFDSLVMEYEEACRTRGAAGEGAWKESEVEIRREVREWEGYA